MLIPTNRFNILFCQGALWQRDLRVWNLQNFLASKLEVVKTVSARMIDSLVREEPEDKVVLPKITLTQSLWQVNMYSPRDFFISKVLDQLRKNRLNL